MDKQVHGIDEQRIVVPGLDLLRTFGHILCEQLFVQSGIIVRSVRFQGQQNTVKIPALIIIAPG